MRVHQPGGHLMRGGRPAVEDWSWAQTRRRLHALYTLARPYKVRTLVAIISLLGATVVSLAPPYLVGRAVDEVQHGETALLGKLVVGLRRGRPARDRVHVRADVFHGLDGRADAR